MFVFGRKLHLNHLNTVNLSPISWLHQVLGQVDQISESKNILERVDQISDTFCERLQGRFFKKYLQYSSKVGGTPALMSFLFLE